MTTIKVGSKDAEGFHPEGLIVDPDAVEEFVNNSPGLAAKLGAKANAASLALKQDITAADAKYATQADVIANTAAIGNKFDKTGTKTDTSAGIVDWQNDSTSGYLLHLRTGPNSTSGASALAIGTDLGLANGLLISHKNGGTGIVATGQPGSGRIVEFTSRGSGSGAWFNVQSGGGAFQINARDGAGYADGATTLGSTTLTSATAAFTAGDIGKSVSQLTSRGTTDPFGCIPANATITAVTNATTAVMSAPAGATGTAIMFNIAGRLPALTQSIAAIMDTDLLTPIAKFTRGGATLSNTDITTIPLTIAPKTGQTAKTLSIKDAAGVEQVSVGSQGNLASSAFAALTNAGIPGADPLTVSTYSSHASIKAGRVGAVTGDNFWAMGGGTTALSRFNKDGVFITKINAAPADADLNPGEGAVWIDPTPGTGGVRWKIKATDGSIINKTL